MLSWPLLKVGLRNPRKALLRLVLGSEVFNRVYGNTKDTCVETSGLDNLLEMHMGKMTDIHEHLATLFMLTVELDCKRVLELGTRDGESTIAFMLAAKKINGKVTSIDVNPCLGAKEVVEGCNLQQYWTFLQADDLQVDWKDPIDHLFIDTSHTFKHTLCELEKYEPHVARGGLITLHDTISYPELLQAIKLYVKGRKDLILYQYFNNNGLAVIFKR